MEAIVVNETKIKISAKRINRVTQEVVQLLLTKKLRNKKLLKQKSEMTLVFLSTAKMKKINHQFRQKNKPTDVLSFASDDPASLGELLFCIDVLKKQARQQKHSLDKEVMYMMIHGLLHLLGYDHELSGLEEKRMFAIQEQAFEHLSHIQKIL